MTTRGRQKDALTRHDTARTAQTGGPDMGIWMRYQQPLAHAASIAVVLTAIVLTFSGTVAFCEAHGAPGWRGWATAAITDVTVLVGLLWPRWPLQALSLLAASFTMLANLGHAAPGPAGAAVALIPPVAAILLVAALEYVVKHPIGGVTPEPEVAQPDPPEVTVEVSDLEPDPPEVKAIEAGSPADAKTREERAAWVKATGQQFTVGQVQETFGVSKSTAQRILTLV